MSILSGPQAKLTDVGVPGLAHLLFAPILGGATTPICAIAGLLILIQIWLKWRDPIDITLWSATTWLILAPALDPATVLWAWVPAMICGVRSWTVLATLSPLFYICLPTSHLTVLDSGEAEWIPWVVYLPFLITFAAECAPDPAGPLAGWSSKDHIAIAVPDLTRSLPLHDALSVLIERIPNAQVIVGLGLHRRLTETEFERFSNWNAVQHDPDDCIVTQKIMGIPGAVHRTVSEADWTISVGVCELHQYAGISGGHKGVAVGCGGRDSIAALHHRDRIIEKGVEVGRIEGNPFRERIDRLGQAAGCHLALNWVPALSTWMIGPPHLVVRSALESMEPWTFVRQRAHGAVLRIPKSKSKSLYQASRAATYLALSPNPPLVEGATLALEASCEEGLGTEAGFVSALESCKPPWTPLLTDTPPTGPGAQRAVMLAMLMQRYTLKIYGCNQPELFRRYGLWASEEHAPKPDNWLDITTPFYQLPQLIQ